MNAHEQTHRFLNERRIIYYTDAKSFGGHEVASLHALQWLIDEGATVTCFYRSTNTLLENRLETLAQGAAQLKLHPITLPIIRFHRLFHLFRPKTLNHIGKAFRELTVELVFVSQGNLEISALGALAAHRQGIPCISYIPMAHSFKAMKSKHGWLRDLFNRYIAQIPDIWLTCTREQRETLRRYGAKQPIHRLPNCIELHSPATQRKAKSELQLNASTPVLGMVGRLNNKQKGCDIFITALIESAPDSPLRAADLLFIGNGEDWPANRNRLEAGGWKGRIHHLEWTQCPERYYAALDLLVMPSHFEGLPLAMQEALLCNVPVAASAVDGLRSFLPKQWLCAPNRPDSLRHLLEQFLNEPSSYRAPIAALQQKIRTEHSTTAFRSALHAAFQLVLNTKSHARDSNAPTSGQITSHERV